MNNPCGYILSFPITQHFGDPDNSISGNHTGCDFAMNVGTELPSIRDGRVVYTSDGSLPPSDINYAQGISVMVESPDGERWWFAHLSRKDVEFGEIVAEGQIIGLSGMTGTATGPHLHLERQQPAMNPIDPLPYLQEHEGGDMLTPEDKAYIDAKFGQLYDALKASQRRQMRGLDPWTDTPGDADDRPIAPTEQVYPSNGRG